MAIDSTDYESYWLLARIYTRQKKYDKGLASAQRAIALNPNSASLLNSLGGNVFTYLGRAREAAEMIEKAMRLDPRHSNSWYGNLGIAYYAAGQYEKTVKALNHIGKPKLHLRLYLAASYAQLGQTEEAQAEIAQILKIDPKVSVDIWAEREPYKDPVDKERWIDGLRKAGLPESPPLPLPDSPSIAVLPFENMSDDPKQEYFSDGLTDQIINGLAKTPYLFVIARNSTFTYKGKAVKVQKVAEDLGVKYVLEGSVQKTADRIRITAQLIDATTGHHLWAENYDRRLKDIFALQDEITMKIMAEMQVKLTTADLGRLSSIKTTNLKAYEKFLKGY